MKRRRLRIYPESENVHASFWRRGICLLSALQKPRGVIIYLRARDFNSAGIEVKLSRRTAIPNELIEDIRPSFQQVFRPGTLYRSTGVVLVNLEDDSVAQLDLFGAALKTIEMKKVYEGVDKMRAKYGKHTLYLGSSHLAQTSAQHSTDRGDEPPCKRVLQKQLGNNHLKSQLTGTNHPTAVLESY